MTRLVLLRHGRTAYNHAGRVQGQLDVALDDEGVAQAARTAPVLAALDPVLLWCSDLQRARVTADALAAVTGLVPRPDPRLREYGLGVREGLTHAEYAALAPEEFALFRQGHYDSAPGSEPTAEVSARMLEVLTELLALVPSGGTAVAVSHGAAVRVAIGAVLGWPQELFHSLRGLDNCGWVVLEQHPDAGALRLAAYNRTAG